MSDFSTIPEPGWYYADGDPIGTHRYWDGAQWVGGPQPVAGAAPMGAVGVRPFAGREAGWGWRLLGWIIDQIVVYGPYYAGLFLLGDPSSEDVSLVELVIILIVIAASIGNSWVYQGLTGQSIGKKIVGIQILRDDTAAPPGIGNMIGRGFLSFLFAIPCYTIFIVDHLWPLWDDENKRLVDKIMKCTVVKASV